MRLSAVFPKRAVWDDSASKETRLKRFRTGAFRVLAATVLSAAIVPRVGFGQDFLVLHSLAQDEGQAPRSPLSLPWTMFFPRPSSI